MGMGRIKQFFKNIFLLTLPILLLFFLIIEVVFRYILPASEYPYNYYDSIDQISKFDLKERAGLFTVGAFARRGGKWRINNFGWNSDIDYHVNHAKPLIAIIGDSFIEALQVDIDKSIAGIIREKVKNKYEVYSFGKSGAALSQYLQMSRYVKKYFNPDIIVINVVHNDFDESLCSCSLARKIGMLCLETNDSKLVEAKISNTPGFTFIPDKVKNIVYRSSVYRYLAQNLKIFNIMNNLKQHFNKREYNANIDVEKVRSQYNDIVKALDYILNKIKQENPGKKIIFIMDALRYDIYNNTLELSNVIWINELLRNKCKQYDLIFIDLTKPFSDIYKLNHIKFESEYDFHWNEYGHRCAAQVLYDKLKEIGLI